MDIVCPTCAAAYEIDDATVPAEGRKVRCAACSTVWRVSLPIEASAPAFEAETASLDWNAAPDAEAQETVPDAAQPQPAAKDNRARWVKGKPSNAGAGRKPTASRAAMASLAAMVIVVAIGIHQRMIVVQHVPQSARLFALLGFPVNLRGIEIMGVASRILDDNGVSVLVVDGDLRNRTSRKVDVPRLRFAVLNPAGQEVYVWSAQADRASLQPGETLNFRRRLATPPGDARDVSVRFVTKADITAGIK